MSILTDALHFPVWGLVTAKHRCYMHLLEHLNCATIFGAKTGALVNIGITLIPLQPALHLLRKDHLLAQGRVR